MAPRRPKKSNTRMQAALEAMQPYGFSKDLILKNVKSLLKEYGGEENWFFIEDDSYKVLLDKILEHVEQEEPQKGDRLAGPSSGILAIAQSETEALDVVLPTNENLLELASQTTGALDTALLTGTSGGNDIALPLPAGEGTGQQDLSQHIPEQQNTDVNETTDKNPSSHDDIGDTNVSLPHAVHTEEPMDGIPIRQRRPYYGWISSDDEVNNDDFVELEPAPLPEELARLLYGTNMSSSGRRRTRWDLRPEDM